MKPKRPLPTERPFLTFMTHTYRRPKGLMQNFRSVATQTAVDAIEQIVLPDHLGVSPADAVYGRMQWYAFAARGYYVHVLGDDDCLAAPDVVARLHRYAQTYDQPPVLVVRVSKGGTEYPKCGIDGEPVEGDVDLCSYVMRRDIWRGLANGYAQHYECDWGGYQALRALAGTQGMAPCDLLFAVGAVGGGRPELDW